MSNTNKRIIDLETKQTLGSGDYLAADSEQGTHKVDANANIIIPLTGLYDNEVEMGAVNLLPNTATTQVESGVTFTVNSDGSVTANGTATGSIYFPIFTALDSNEYPLIVSKRYKLSGCPSGGSQNTFRIYLEMNSEIVTDSHDFGNGTTFTAPAFNVRFGVYIRVYSGVTFNNAVFKPMFTVADMPNSDYAHYVPYAKSNKELTHDIIPLNNSVAGSNDAYDSTKAYVVGDLVIYNNKLYRCKTACSAASWNVNSANFEETTLTKVATQLNNELNEVPTHYLHMTQGNFAWNNEGKLFKSLTSSQIPDRSKIRTIMIRPTNGQAVLGVYIAADGYISVCGVVPKTMSNDIGDYQFDLYIGYV